jgi:deoxyinosine 3'endonuclease (endonuclease V)
VGDVTVVAGQQLVVVDGSGVPHPLKGGVGVTLALPQVLTITAA